MSRFTEAIETLQTQIKKLGDGKNFTISEEGLDPKTRPNPPPISSILQAVWNISAVLFDATRKGKIHLVTNGHKLLKCLLFLAPEDKGIPEISDDKTYQLSLTLRNFFQLTLDEYNRPDPDVKNLLTFSIIGMSIDVIGELRKVMEELNSKISSYEKRLSKETETLQRYKDSLAALLSAYPYIPDPPPFVITRSTSDDEAQRLEADSTSYTALITQLTNHHRQWIEREQQLNQKLTAFEATFPIPPELSQKERFETARNEAKEELRIKCEEARREHAKIHELLLQAQRELHEINEQLTFFSHGKRDEKLGALRAKKHETLAAASTSRRIYEDEKSALEAMPGINSSTLVVITAGFDKRKARLNRIQEDIHRILLRLAPPFSGIGTLPTSIIEALNLTPPGRGFASYFFFY